MDATGRPSFQALQHRGAHPDHTVVFYAFDLLHVNGADVTGRPLEERRTMLAEVVEGSQILLSSELPGSAQQVVAAVASLGLEGVIAKRRSSRYTPGERHTAWVKLKLTSSRSSSSGVSARTSRNRRVAGRYYDGAAGAAPSRRRCGGVHAPPAREVLARRATSRAAMPFVESAHTKGRAGRGSTAEQWPRRSGYGRAGGSGRFGEWTSEGHLRHAAFPGLRTDKLAKRDQAGDVARESAPIRGDG